MIITIDASALMAVLVNETHKANIIELTRDMDLQAPETLDAEIGNALSAMMKRKRITLNQAENVLAQLDGIPIRRTRIRLKHALPIAYRFDMYAYDAYVLDCARQFRTSLLSLDLGMLKAAEALDIRTLEVS